MSNSHLQLVHQVHASPNSNQWNVLPAWEPVENLCWYIPVAKGTFLTPLMQTSMMKNHFKGRLLHVGLKWTDLLTGRARYIDSQCRHFWFWFIKSEVLILAPWHQTCCGGGHTSLPTVHMVSSAYWAANNFWLSGHWLVSLSDAPSPHFGAVLTAFWPETLLK